MYNMYDCVWKVVYNELFLLSILLQPDFLRIAALWILKLSEQYKLPEKNSIDGRLKHKEVKRG